MPIKAARIIQVEVALPASLEPLREVAQNLSWTWSTDAIALYQRLGRDLWETAGHNPVRVLQLVPRERLDELAEDPGFLHHLDRVAGAMRAYLSREPRLRVPETSAQECIAYFSLEFALTESLQTYSGGLGVLAGDHLKSASDLGLPFVGVTLLYAQGYFQQSLDPEGRQIEEYHDVEFASQPVRRVLREDGEPLTVAVPFDSRDVVAAIWQMDVGQATLYLLDSDVEGNSAADRKISSRLYGGDLDMRIQQEILLGIGGLRALAALGYRPAVCHMNEGHSALLAVDRIRMLMEESGASFEEARLPVTAATVFTTHTAVAAGIDLFPPDLVRRHLGQYYTRVGLDDRSFLGLGRMNPQDDGEPFSMAVLGLRLSGYCNGVSQMHQTVSRALWSAAWPNLPTEQIPIDAITNGVHLPTWVSHELGELYDSYVGTQWRDNPTNPGIWQSAANLPDGELWEVREHQRERLVHRARQLHHDAAARRGLSGADVASGRVLDPHVLTVGFARRFAGYKRATLLFRDAERLARLVNHAERPVQFIFAGKAHPRDEPAKQLIRQVLAFTREREFRDRIVLIENYDVDVARSLVQGCDAWLNNPLRPLEASGTSGMKAAVNGVLNISVPDGWWAEAYRPGNGWVIGRTATTDDPEVQDAFDADSLYDLFENEVAPLFYNRDADGMPRGWLAHMKECIASIAPRFNTSRMVEEYASHAYEPSARAWQRLRSDNLRPARDLAGWLERVRRGWDAIKVLDIDDDTQQGARQGAPVNVRVQVHAGELAPGDIRVDIAYGPAQPGGQVEIEAIEPMRVDGVKEDGVATFVGSFRAPVGGRIGYGVRILPNHPELFEPLDAGLVKWS